MVREVLRGAPYRKMVSRRLAEKDDVHYSPKSSALKRLMAEHMVAVNNRAHSESGPDQLASDFFEETYRPWCEANKKHSTSLSYKHIWPQHLAEHFGGRALGSYRTNDASKFLTSLAEKGYGRNTISHARSLMSGMFSHAVNLGLLAANPMRDAKALSKMKPPGETESYSLREVEDLVSVLAERTDAQLVVALCGFLALRPSECAAIQWQDVDLESGMLHLRRARVRGVVGDLKTLGCAASRPMFEPVASIFGLWASKSARRAWVFENQAGNSADLKEMVRRVIRPAIAKWNETHAEKIEWRSLYALRRTAASLLWSLTGSVEASQQVLRHATPAVRLRHYLKPDRTELVRGLKMLAEATHKKE